LKPGDTLPSVRTLAAELLVSVITVKRAYEELEHDGIIYSRQGIGTFVAEAGAIETKRIKLEAARAALREAVANGRDGGLTDKDLLDWLKSEF
jgi:GntR family transcriptional regulator